MCLTVRKVPTKKQIIICKKTLYTYNGLCTTPFYGKEVRQDGWLFPDRVRNSSIGDGDKIRGGYIHAYTKKKAEYEWAIYYRAYAFGVAAYNADMTEFVCRALYIPYADKTKSDTEDIILSFARYNKGQILKALPVLKRIEKYL